jgi:hypothetical protein
MSMPQRPLGLDPKEPAVQAAVFGVQVEEWMNGEVGSFVMGRVRQSLKRLEKELKKIDPEKTLAVARIQWEISHWEGFAGWLGDAIQAGYDAQAIIEGEQLASTEDG